MNVSHVHYSKEPMNVIYGLHLGDRRYRYIGLTTKGTNSRMTRHKVAANSGKTTAVYQWMKKHGVDSIHISVIEIVEDQNLLPNRERFWIGWYRSNGYDLLNHTDGGEGSFGFKHTELARQLMSETRTGRKHTEATRALMSRLRMGRKLSEEACANISKGQKGKVISPETRARISEAKSGTKMSEEQRAKMEKWWSGERFRGVPLSEDHRAKLSNAAKGRKASEATKQKMSAQRRGVPKSPELKHRQYHTSRGRSVPTTCNYCKEETT